MKEDPLCYIIDANHVEISNQAIFLISLYDLFRSHFSATFRENIVLTLKNFT